MPAILLTLSGVSTGRFVAARQARHFVSTHPDSLLWWLDDDLDLCREMLPRLRSTGWQVKTFARSEPMLAALRAGLRPDLLVLDQRLPDQLGTELLRDLRQSGECFPVLMLSAMARATDRILGLELGAQDYLVKPFHAREMLLRCEQLLELSRHLAVSPSRQEQQINLGGLTFHPHEGCLRRAGAAAVTLSRGERILLLALCRAPGRVLTREQLALASGSLAPASSSRSIDMRLSRLRRLLEQASGGSVQIETVRAHGYTLRIEAPAREESGEEQTSEEVS